MPRRPRIVHPNEPHHITQRGFGRQLIFDIDDDRRLFLRLLGKYATQYELEIWGYCLMPNHFHLIAVPHNPGSIANALRQLQADYARYFNLRRDTTGHLWQSRYHSTPMDDANTWRALAYIERNPVRAAITEQAELFPWSSAPFHYGIQSPPPWLNVTAWRSHWKPAQWRRLLRESKDETAFAEQFHAATATGRPLGDPAPQRGRRAKATATAA